VSDVRYAAETRRALFRALLAARCAGEPVVSRNRVVVALLMAAGVADALIEEIEDPNAISFDECQRRAAEEVARSGFAFGSREHIAAVRPLPVDPEAERPLRALLEQHPHPEIMPLDALRALLRADPALAARLARRGFPPA
jgi:hypothetical protein